MKRRTSFKDVFCGRNDSDFRVTPQSLMETPASPARLLLLHTISAAVFAGLAGSYFGWLDVYAVATGRIQISGRTKVVQPSTSGVIQSIYVSDGDTVQEGDLLLKLDNVAAMADLNVIKTKLSYLRAENLRRRTSSEIATAGSPFGWHPIEWNKDITPTIRSLQEDTLRADLDRLRAGVLSIDTQIAQSASEQEKYSLSSKAQAKLVAVLQERVEMRQQLESRGAASRANVLDAEQTRLSAQTTLTDLEGSLTVSAASMNVLRAQRETLIAQFIEENQNKIATNTALIEEADSQAEKLADQLSRLQIVSPVSGIIAALTVTTTGQFVQSGQEVMRVVPNFGKMEVEAYISNSDIAFVKLGQNADIKVDSIPYTRYGTIGATVVNIAYDSITGAEAAQQQHDSSISPSGRLSITSAAEKTQDLVFRVILRLDAESINVDGHRVDLSSGMTVTADIKTERRRLLDYILSPIKEVGATAFKER